MPSSAGVDASCLGHPEDSIRRPGSGRLAFLPTPQAQQYGICQVKFDLAADPLDQIVADTSFGRGMGAHVQTGELAGKRPCRRHEFVAVHELVKKAGLEGRINVEEFREVDRALVGCGREAMPEHGGRLSAWSDPERLHWLTP